ncbi:MAG: DUF924 domain-containing protein [Gammaproteobacteria bacterium]|nr:DUF924 domain-containing protein [Gammaproteobacteria bacterium]
MKNRSFDAVLNFWFGSLDEGFADDAHRRLWFNGGAEMDLEVRDRFQHLSVAAEDGSLSPWLEQINGSLAFILVCDQFPRNIFRGERAAFAYDGLALEAARNGVESGLDLELGYDERAFFYMPFEHSERLTDQKAAVDLFTRLRDESPPARQNLTGNNLRHAQQHRDIIARFGRFPHRNVVLGRDSSDEELAFIAGGAGFGQQPR